MTKKKYRRVKDALLWVFLAGNAVLFLYIGYLNRVINVKDVEEIRARNFMMKKSIEHYDTIAAKDSVIFELEDSISVLKSNMDENKR